ncbi:MAG TPA: hypothetical protein VHL99_00915 [Candidatus Binatia bacterium]|jgi:hypothetical protein|nr:hypothetical protein [Candidatus Binatia bacterium]
MDRKTRRRRNRAAVEAARPPERRREIAEEMEEFSKLFRPLENPKQRAFLMAYVRTLGIRSAMRLSGVERQDHYFWLKTDARYADIFAEAHRMLGDMLEEEVMRRAYLGTDTPIVYRGTITSWHKSYSDQLAMFLLRAFKPQKYHRVAHDGYPGGPTEINIRVLKPGEKLTDAEKQPPVFSIGAAKPETEPAEPNALPTISLPHPDGGDEEQ